MIPLMSKAVPSPQTESTARKGKRHQSDDENRRSSTYGLFYQEKKLTGLADNVMSTSALCAGASNTNPHGMSRQWDASSHAECASYQQAACRKVQDSNKKRKTYKKQPLGKLDRTALENHAINAYWEAAASSAEKRIGKTSALAIKHQTQLRTQSTSQTLGGINFEQPIVEEARKSISGVPLHELSVLLCQPYPHLGTGRLQLAGPIATLCPLLEREKAKRNQKA